MAKRIDALTHGRAQRVVKMSRFAASRQRREWLHALEQADIAVVHGFQDGPRLAHLIRSKLPFVYMPHSPSIMANERRSIFQDAGIKLPDWEYKRILASEARLIEYSRAVIFPSPRASNEYFNTYGSALNDKTVRFVPSGVAPLPKSRPATGSSKRKPRVLFAGRYVGQKGYDLYCTAAAHLQHMNVPAEFVSIGAGPLPTTPPVRDEGWSEDPAANIQAADIVVVPNRVSYFDLLPLECASLGKPMVFTPVGGSLDQAAELPDCIVSGGVTVEELAEAIRLAVEKVLEDPTWGSRNAAVYHSKFTTCAMAQKWGAVLSEVFQRTPR